MPLLYLISIKTKITMNSGKAILGVLAGIAAGTLIGVLFAPEKGNATRKKISKKGQDLADALDEKIDRKFNELLESFNEKLGLQKTKRNSSQEKNREGASTEELLN
jgi:gas vesicle protein